MKKVEGTGLFRGREKDPEAIRFRFMPEPGGPLLGVPFKGTGLAAASVSKRKDTPLYGQDRQEKESPDANHTDAHACRASLSESSCRVDAVLLVGDRSIGLTLLWQAGPLVRADLIADRITAQDANIRVEAEGSSNRLILIEKSLDRRAPF